MTLVSLCVCTCLCSRSSALSLCLCIRLLSPQGAISIGSFFTHYNTQLIGLSTGRHEIELPNMVLARAHIPLTHSSTYVCGLQPQRANIPPPAHIISLTRIFGCVRVRTCVCVC